MGGWRGQDGREQKAEQQNDKQVVIVLDGMGCEGEADRFTTASEDGNEVFAFIVYIQRSQTGPSTASSQAFIRRGKGRVLWIRHGGAKVK